MSLKKEPIRSFCNGDCCPCRTMETSTSASVHHKGIRPLNSSQLMSARSATSRWGRGLGGLKAFMSPSAAHPSWCAGSPLPHASPLHANAHPHSSGQ